MPRRWFHFRRKQASVPVGLDLLASFGLQLRGMLPPGDAGLANDRSVRKGPHCRVFTRLLRASFSLRHALAVTILKELVRLRADDLAQLSPRLD